MILYNVTVSLELDIQEDWIAWMKETHIPNVMATGIFTEHKMLRLIGQSESDGHATYAMQYFCPSLSALQRYMAHFAPALQKEATDRYQGKFTAFRTVLEVM